MQEEHPLLSHPPTPPWEAGCTSDVKVVLLNDHCVPEVGFAPKSKLAACSGTRDASVPAPARTRRRGNVQVSRVCSLPSGQVSTASASPLQVLTPHKMIPHFPTQLPYLSFSLTHLQIDHVAKQDFILFTYHDE